MIRLNLRKFKTCSIKYIFHFFYPVENFRYLIENLKKKTGINKFPMFKTTRFDLPYYTV